MGAGEVSLCSQEGSTMQDVSIKVTRIGSKWHARLFDKEGKVIDEMAADLRIDIGHVCRTMLRWYDKCGGMSRFASSARARMWNLNKHPVGSPKGRIYYQGELINQKEKRKKSKCHTIPPASQA